MSAQIINGTRIFNSRPFTVDGELLRTGSLKSFVPPKLTAEAGVAHWFARGWHRSARDLSDFIGAADYDFGNR